MTALLSMVLRRLPIGWLQLTHNRARLFAAIAGVAFANLLIFVQLGLLGALSASATLPYLEMKADILISASDANTLTDGSDVPRQRMFQALAVPGVKNATPLYVGKIDWEPVSGTSVALDVLAIDPTNSSQFWHEKLGSLGPKILAADTVALDDRSRNTPEGFFENIRQSRSYTFETKGRTLRAVETFGIGAGFNGDGFAVMSDQTFLRLFPQKRAGTPTHILVNAADGVPPSLVVSRLKQALTSKDIQIRTLKDASDRDVSYQTTERPVGIIFGFGVAMGLMVGTIIVYQVLSTDVADHLKEYATLKAVGYRQSFFLGIVFEEAFILAIFGFIPGILLSLALYQGLTAATQLPVSMSEARALSVFLATLVMCGISGAIATRRLAAADPADLF